MNELKLDERIRPMHETLSRLLTRELGDGACKDDELTEAQTKNLAGLLLRDAVREQASDIHVEPQREGFRIRFRVDGALLDAKLLDKETGKRLLRHYKTLAGLDPVATFRPQDARRTVELDNEEVDIRLACAPCTFGEKLTMRLLHPDQLNRRLNDLGLSESAEHQITNWLSNVSGMFLVTGPTGSGKTTTLYSLLHELKVAERSVVTVEDPVEYRIDGISQMQVDRRHGVTFEEALRSMLRLDPDYLLLGEIRDAASAQAALEAATSGRVLLSTLHSRDAVNAVTALRNWDLADHEIASALEVVVSQRLVRKLCPHCRERRAVKESEQSWFATLGLSAPSETWHAPGCGECRNLGYRGRTGIFEVWRLTESDHDCILNHEDEHTLRERLSDRMHVRMLEDALEKVDQGVTSLDQVRSVPGLVIAAAVPKVMSNPPA